MASTIHPLAGRRAPASALIDVAALVVADHADQPDPTVTAQRVAFGTSGHRGSAFDRTFNEWHVLDITQAICNQRKAQGVTGLQFPGIDTHALSASACASALEVLAAKRLEEMLATGDEFTPTPAVSHAVLGHNRERAGRLADGTVTPSAGLLAPDHDLAVAIDCLFQHRPPWSPTAAIGKTVVSSRLIDRLAAGLGRRLCEMPMGFKWFVHGLHEGSLGLRGERTTLPHVDATLAPASDSTSPSLPGSPPCPKS